MEKLFIFVFYIVNGFSDANTHQDLCAATYYEELGVATDVDTRAIKGAYRRAAAIHHPDKGGSHDKFVCVGVAYEVLHDAETRKVYDTALIFRQLAKSIEDPSQGDCADRVDKEACVAELMELLRQLFRNASFDPSSETLAEYFDVEGTRQQFGFNDPLDDILEEAWANFTAECPVVAAFMTGVGKGLRAAVYIHSFTSIKFMLALSGSSLHQIWAVFWTIDKIPKSGQQLLDAARSVARYARRMQQILITTAKGGFRLGRRLVTSLEKLVSRNIIEAPPFNLTYVDVADMFDSSDTVEMYTAEGDVHSFKCCCHDEGKCKLTKTTNATSRLFQLFNPNGCGKLVGMSWHSYKTLNRPCEITESEAIELRDSQVLKSPKTEL